MKDSSDEFQFDSSKEILKIIYRPLLLWIGGLSLFYLLIPASIFFIHVDRLCDIFSPTSGYCDLFLGQFNKKIFTYQVAGGIAATCIATSVLMWWVTGLRGAFWESYKLYIFISLSILLLSIYIFTTGGFLDSPFSGVLSLYVANFLIMQGNHSFLNFKIFIIAFTIFLIVLPYIVLTFGLHEENIFMLRWGSANWVTNTRLYISLFLFLITTISSNNINRKIMIHSNNHKKGNNS